MMEKSQQQRDIEDRMQRRRQEARARGLPFPDKTEAETGDIIDKICKLHPGLTREKAIEMSEAHGF